MKSGWSKNALVMQLLRSLFFLVAKRGILLSGVHIPGRENDPADALSHNSLGLFLSQVSFAQQEQSTISPELIRLLLTERPDRTSRNWTHCWNDFLLMA